MNLCPQCAGCFTHCSPGKLKCSDCGLVSFFKEKKKGCIGMFCPLRNDRCKGADCVAYSETCLFVDALYSILDMAEE